MQVKTRNAKYLHFRGKSLRIMNRDQKAYSPTKITIPSKRQPHAIQSIGFHCCYQEKMIGLHRFAMFGPMDARGL
jgi:hypothetical protein